MKKNLMGVLAIVLAIGGSAFTQRQAVVNEDIYDWRVFQNGSPTSQFLDNLTESEVRSMYPECDGLVTTCFQAYDKDNHNITPGILIQKN